MTIYQVIQEFVNLGLDNGSIEPLDSIYLRNQVAHFIGVEDWQEPNGQGHETDSLKLLDELLLEAGKNQVIPEGQTEFFESALMDFVTPKPSYINQEFWKNYEKSPKGATDYFYGLAQSVNQVKTRDIARNIAYDYTSKYGNLEITINLSKPEKDPKAIAAAKSAKASTYPACQLCLENEGYYGHPGYPARSNHRIVQLNLNGENYGFQYSPYAYYDEHSIVMNENHVPMAIDAHAFANLLAFLDKFPHYMIGSNADLPIVGGSILTHDHYQAGRHEFPMAKAEIRENTQLMGFENLSAGIVSWPMSVLRLISADKNEILAASYKILEAWQKYSDEGLDISTLQDNIQHHTITPIARIREGNYEMDLVLRDNNVSEAHPDGIFHPHAHLHHIKKENIGLIEVMGLAILPPRLKGELTEVEKFLLNQPNEISEIHQDWANQLKAVDTFTAGNVHEKVQAAVGAVFEEVLENAGVYKDDEAGRAGFARFIKFVNED